MRVVDKYKEPNTPQLNEVLLLECGHKLVWTAKNGDVAPQDIKCAGPHCSVCGWGTDFDSLPCVHVRTGEVAK